MTAPPIENRDEQILSAAVRLAQTGRWATMTRGQVAAAAGLSAGTVSNYGRVGLTSSPYPSEGIMAVLRAAVLEWAVTHGDLPLVAQGLAARHPVALAAPEQLRVAAVLG